MSEDTAVNGHPVFSPITVEAYERGLVTKTSLTGTVRMTILAMLKQGDQKAADKFRALINTMDDANSVYGTRRVDTDGAAIMIVDYAREEGISVLTEANVPGVKSVIQQALEGVGLSHKQLLPAYTAWRKSLKDERSDDENLDL